jgi:hypothetical protein
MPQTCRTGTGGPAVEGGVAGIGRRSERDGGFHAVEGFQPVKDPRLETGSRVGAHHDGPGARESMEARTESSAPTVRPVVSRTLTHIPATITMDTIEGTFCAHGRRHRLAAQGGEAAEETHRSTCR